MKLSQNNDTNAFGVKIIFKNKKVKTAFERHISRTEHLKIFQDAPTLTPKTGKDIKIRIGLRKEFTKGLVTGEYDNFTFETRESFLGRKVKADEVQFRCEKKRPQSARVIPPRRYDGEKIMPAIKSILTQIDNLRAKKA